MSAAGDELEALLQLIRVLRDPESGCPWDREQNFVTIAPFTIEEAYEVADAIGRGDLDRLRDELGDLLFQVVFHARMAEEAGRFDFAAVARGIRDKLIRRHPHLFLERKAVDVAALHVTWEAQKASKRAAAGVREKIDEELAEIDAALAAGSRPEAAEEIGDLLFTIANWARHLEVDAEDALRRAALKFERRFESMERAAEAAGLVLNELDAARWEELWRDAKSMTKKE